MQRKLFTFRSHLHFETLCKTACLTLIATWYIHYTFPPFFTRIFQIPAEIKTNEAKWLIFKKNNTVKHKMYIFWIWTDRRMLRLKNPRQPSQDGTPKYFIYILNQWDLRPKIYFLTIMFATGSISTHFAMTAYGMKYTSPWFLFGHCSL